MEDIILDPDFLLKITQFKDVTKSDASLIGSDVIVIKKKYFYLFPGLTILWILTMTISIIYNLQTVNNECSCTCENYTRRYKRMDQANATDVNIPKAENALLELNTACRQLRNNYRFNVHTKLDIFNAISYDSTLSKEGRENATTWLYEALNLYAGNNWTQGNQKKICIYMREKFEGNYGGYWQCVSNSNNSNQIHYSITYNPNVGYISFDLNDSLSVMLFKSREQASCDDSCDAFSYFTMTVLVFVVSIILFIASFFFSCGFILWQRLTIQKFRRRIELLSLNQATTNSLIVIPIEQLDIGKEKLGEGQFGSVYSGGYITKEGIIKNVAIKNINNVDEQELIKEAGIMARLSHMHLIKLFGICLADGAKIIIPLRSLGSLNNYLHANSNKIKSSHLILYCYQISLGMEYLAERQIVHRDLATRNVLMKDSKHVEITDFGLSGLIQNDITTPSLMPSRWMAMECLEEPQRNLYCEATDVWSFGITCWEILTFAQLPYENVVLDPSNVMQSLYNYLINGNRLSLPEKCSVELTETLLLCWASNPTSRPNFKTLKEKFNKYNDTPNCFILIKPTNDLIMRTNSSIVIPIEQIDIGEEKLGEGQFGSVYSGHYITKEGRIKVAIKNIKNVDEQKLIKEAGIMARLSHKHLIKLIGICLADGTKIVLPLRSLGTLKNYLHANRNKLKPSYLILYCYQISLGMEYLAERQIVHRDLATRNVLMKDSKHVEITDFRLSGLIQNSIFHAITTPSSMPYRWVAMECLKDPQKNLYCEATDVWSFGITCWEILTFAQLPYENVVLDPSNVMQSLYNYLNNGNRLSMPERSSLELFETLLLCWTPKHTLRPNFKTLKETFNKYNDTPNRFVLIKKPNNDVETTHQELIEEKNEYKNRETSNQLEDEQATEQGFEQEISNHPESEQASTSLTTNILPYHTSYDSFLATFQLIKSKVPKN